MTENQPTPPPDAYQQAPPKKSNTARNLGLGCLLVLVLMIGGCFAFTGLAVNEVDKAMSEIDEAIDEEMANDKPAKVNQGEAFTHDGFEAAPGWKVGREFGTVTIAKLKLTNTKKSETGGSGRTAMLTFRFYKGRENLAEVECTSNELQKGESSTADCFSTSQKFPKNYDTIKVADFW